MDSDKWTRLQMLSKQVTQIDAKLPMKDLRWELEIERRSVEFMRVLNEGIDEAKLFLNAKLEQSKARNEDSRRDLERFLSSYQLEDQCKAGSRKQCCTEEESLFVNKESKRNEVVEELVEKLRKEEEKTSERIKVAEHLKLEVEELNTSLKDAQLEICALWAQKEKEAAKAKSVIEDLRSQMAKGRKEIEELSKSESDLQTLVTSMRERCQDHAQLQLKNKHLSELLALSQQDVDDKFHRAESERAHNEHLQNQLHAKDVQINNLSANVAILADALREVDMNFKQLNLPFVVPAEWRNWLENLHVNRKTLGFAGTHNLPANKYDRTPSPFDQRGVNSTFDLHAILFDTLTSNNESNMYVYFNTKDKEVEKTLSWRPLVPMAVLMAEADAATSYSAAQPPEPVHFTDKAGRGHAKPGGCSNERMAKIYQQILNQSVAGTVLETNL